jgi:general secretion pathway protein L
MLLERELWLPLAAEREMVSALGYEIDRATPFRPEEVFWSGEMIRRDHRRGRLLIRLLLVPRAIAAPLVAAAAAAGLPPDILEGCGADGTRRQLMLAETAWQPWQGRALAGAALACALLTIAVVAAPLLLQASNQAAVETRILGLQPQFREAEALQQRLEQDAAGSDMLTASQAEFGTAIGILATVTTLLPDDTFLTDLTLKQRQLLLRGQSANAARLIAALAADPAIRNPSFAAPVTRAAAGGPDLFSITADAAP